MGEIALSGFDITEEQWAEMVAYVGLGERDAVALAVARPHLVARLDELADGFYQAILAHEGAASVFTGPGQVRRLKQSLKRWIEELLDGPWDHAYCAKRHRIGRVHVRVGLPDRYVFAAMNRLRGAMVTVLRAHLTGQELWDATDALARITDLELSIMSSAYLQAHEQVSLKGLQDLIIENLPVTVLVLDDHGRVTSATHPSWRLFGPTADVGRHYETFLPADLVEQADLPTAVGRALATGREVTLPRVVIGEGVEARHLRITLVPLEHSFARLLLHIEELTDVVKAEAQARQIESLARIGGLAAHMAHEIRNPLAAISATLQVIVGSLPEDDRRKAILGKVQGQVHRLDRLVSDLLGYARPAKVRLQSLDLEELAREAVARAGVVAQISVAEPSAASALADRESALQVLVNLLQNARDASGDEGRLSVRVGPGPQIWVLDDGPGISDELSKTLFEPFVTSKTKGTGLGLAICRKLMLSMGGSVDLGPTPASQGVPLDPGRGPGACFVVEFAPLAV